MAFAIVHFTVGFVSILLVLWLMSITRYRSTGAYFGGIWGLLPDLEKILDGKIGVWASDIHHSSVADLFFLHSTLDQPSFRTVNVKLTFLALSALGISFLLVDWQFGRRSPLVGAAGIYGR
jgi:hypothetical protein